MMLVGGGNGGVGVRFKEGQADIEITLSRYLVYAWGGNIFLLL